MDTPRLVIAGTHSGVGKTTLATGIMAALAGNGLNVQGFKVGPDYIDPGYHHLATGQFSRNLDYWMMGEQGVCSSFYAAAASGDINIIEGVMGLFDGAHVDGSGSTAHVAKLLEAPVILVVDVRSMGQSAAAVVNGYRLHWPQLNVAGVIINKVGSDKHKATVIRAIEEHCGIPVVGVVYRDTLLATPERHLGLLPVAEHGQAQEKVSALSEVIQQTVDLKKLLDIARAAKRLTPPLMDKKTAAGRAVKIAVARDDAFNFYYQDSLDTLAANGAELKYFSPLKDDRLPENIDGLIIGGGFPETHLEALAANKSMQKSLKDADQAGMPIYAECGGFMYLCHQVVDVQGNAYPMVGLVPGTTLMSKKLVGMGYITAVAQRETLICSAEEQFRGHEFHYSQYQPSAGQDDAAFKFYGGRGQDGRRDGYARGNILASYLHLNMFGSEKSAQRFIERCRHFQKKRQG